MQVNLAINQINKLENREAKRRILAMFQEQYGVVITKLENHIDRFSEEYLYSVLFRKYHKQIEHRAAIKIQAYYRMSVPRKQWLAVWNRRNQAAIMIQRNYRVYRRFKILPKMFQDFKHSKAIVIQKYMRGYNVCFQKYGKKICLERLKHNFDYFDELRGELEVQAANVIRFYYLRRQFKKAIK